jgi:DNA phosphorothioation-associated putative methyltransferase
VDLADFRHFVDAIPFGKRLPGAVYFLWDRRASLSPSLDQLLRSLVAEFKIPEEFNIIKFHNQELKISFLAYPTFFDSAHPALSKALVLDLTRNSKREVDYRGNPNPPILHRKEAFLPAGHPRREEFATLTRAEEEAGLYVHTATIGFKLNWENLLATKSLAIEGHMLRPRSEQFHGNSTTPEKTVVPRHKTALTRYDLSKPVKGLLEHGLLRKGVTIFDYGCGQGSDVAGLSSLGFDTIGWDPVHRPSELKRVSEIVNFGYVLNVIEDPAERLEALVDAHRHTTRLLVVSALIQETVCMDRAETFSDGVLTKRGTFQKYFEQHELHQYIEDALETPAIPVGLGVFYVFRDPAEYHDFLASRSRRAINWQEISARLGFSRPNPKQPRWLVIYEENRDLLQAFWGRALELGRQPAPEEFSLFTELVDRVGSAKTAMRLLFERGGRAELEHAASNRRNDLLVYLGLANLKRKVPFGQLSQSLRLDIRTFFGDYQAALGKGLELLFAAGDPGEIEIVCDDLKIGWQDQQAVYVHKSLMNDLPGVLRAYVGCACALFGDVEQTDLVKVHKRSGKVTFLKYDDFQQKPLPILEQRTKVNLRTRWVEAFDHRSEGQLLYYKERFLSPSHPDRPAMEKFSAKLKKLGIPDSMSEGPTRERFEGLRLRQGLNENLNSIRNRSAHSERPPK